MKRESIRRSREIILSLESILLFDRLIVLPWLKIIIERLFLFEFHII